MSRRPAWKTLMDQFAKHRYTMEAAIMDELESMDLDAIKRTLAACGLAGRMSCDWATYEVAPVVRRLALDVLKKRKTPIEWQPEPTTKPEAE